MTDTFQNLLEPITEPEFYSFSFISFPEDFNSPITIDFSSIDTLKSSLKAPTGTEIFRFLAIGNSYLGNDEIETIIKEIEETGRISNKEKLISHFGYDVIKWGDLTNVKFIPYKFGPTNSVFYVKNILSNYLFNKLENKLKFTKENSFMFGFKNLTIENSKTRLLSILNKKFIEGNLKYNSESAKYELMNYIFNEEDLEILSNLSIRDLLLELETEKYDKFFKFRDIYVNCGYRIQDKNLNEIVSLPMPLLYKESNLNLKNIKIDSYNTNKILRDIIDSNEFYFYIFNNVMTEIENKKYNPDFSKRFFPLINEKNFSEILKEEITVEDESVIISQRESFNRISTIEEIVDNYVPSENLEEIDIEYFEVKHNLFFPNNYELVRLFNEIKLSFNIPFIKFKDPLTKEMVYKLYKPITQIIGPEYIPILSKEELLEWIKYSGYNIEDNEVVKIKGNPRELSIKIKIIDYKESNIINEGIVKNININDKSYDVEFDGIIYPNIVFYKEKKDKQEYKIGEKIKFFKSRILYADVSISLKGTISFRIDLTNINEVKAVEMETIIGKYNEFIVFITNLESMQVVKSFQTIITNPNLSVKGDLRSLKSQLGMKSKSEKQLTYSSLYSLINVLYPYFIYDEIAFKTDEYIDFFNGKKWVNAQVKEFIGDKIKISIFDPKQGITKEEEQIVDRKFLKAKSDVENRKYVSFRYKRVSDFEAGNAIRNLIMKLNNLNIPKTVILERIIETFNISKEVALKKLGDIIETEGKTLEKIRGNTGIVLSIDWVNSKEGLYEVNLEDINSLGDFKYVIKLSRFIFDLNSFLYGGIDNDYFEIHREFLETLISQTLKEKIEEEDKLSNIEQDMNRGIEEELFRETAGDIIDIFGDFGMEEEVEIVPLEEEKEAEEELRKDIDREYREEILLVEGKHSSNNVILEKLYEVDPDLFDWKEKSYSKVCQSIRRYPKIMSDKKKQEIDERDRKNKRPSSYTTIKSVKDTPTSSEGEDCLIGKKLRLGKGGKLKCKALLWGSNEENKYWYVCPRIWDTLEGKPLNIEDLDQEGDFLKFKSKNPDTVEWRIDKTTGKDITEFNPRYKRRTFFEETKQKIVPTPSKSLLFMPVGENYSFPGFLNPSNHPKNLNVPCCFQDKSTRVKEVLDELGGKIGFSEKNKYIQNWGKKLDANRLGLLPPSLRSFFEVNIYGGYNTGSLTSETKDWFRMGIQSGPDMFFNLIANIYTTVYKEKKMTGDDLKSIIVENLNETEFRILNYGNLNTWFLINSISTPFQNYLEYTLSNQDKDWELYYDLLTKPNNWLFPEGLNLIILEYQTLTTDDKINILCTNYLCSQSYTDLAPTVVVLKKRSEEGEGLEVMEPIYYFKGNLIPLTFIPTKINSSDYPPIADKIISLKRNCVNIMKFNGYNNVNKNFSKFHKSIFGYDFSKNLYLEIVEKKYLEKIKKYVLNDYNKVIGIILNDPNNLYLPVLPSPISNSITPEKLITIEDLYQYKNRSLLLEYETAIQNYKNMEKIYRLVPVIDLYANNKSEINGFICQYGLVVPIKKDETSSNLKKVVNYNNIDKTIKDYRKKFIQANYNQPGTLEESSIIIEGIVNEFYEDIQYKYSSYLVDNDYVVGLIINVFEIDGEEETELIDIVVPIKKVYIAEGETRRNLVGKVAIQIEDFGIFDIVEYIKESGNLKKLSGYELQVLPLKGIIDEDKKYRRILIETGLEIKLNKDEIFYITDKEDINSEYKVNLIAENFVSNSLNKVDIEYDESFDNNENPMIKKVLEISYKQDILDSLRMQIANYINRIENREIKFLLKELIDDIRINDTNKKTLILVIIRYLYSILVKDFKPSSILSLPKINTEIVLISLTKKECRNYKWTSFSKPEVELVEIEIENEFLNNYYQEFTNLTEKIDIKHEFCRLLIDNKYKEDYIDSLSEELIRNRYRREQIINNKDIKEKGERFKWNKNTEVFFNETELKTKFISSLFMIFKQVYYTKYFPIDIEIGEIPSVEIDGRKISFNIKYKIGDRIRDFTLEKQEIEPEENRNRANFQRRKGFLTKGLIIDLGKKEELKYLK